MIADNLINWHIEWLCNMWYKLQAACYSACWLYDYLHIESRCIDNGCIDNLFIFNILGTYTYASGDKYEGNFKDDKRDGQGNDCTVWSVV